tara:strand:- start:1523 stop:2398 length:876 start_codon:yes stop_codon:yes gene_type:complete
MPIPPDHDSHFQIQYVTNQLLAGCTPPSHLIVQFAKEPGLDMGALFLPGNWQDIVQGMFAGKKGRGTNPARHGRKRGKLPGIPDVDERIGKRLGSAELAAAARKLPGFKLAFGLLNVVEGVNFSAAILDGLTETGFAAMTGFFEVQPDACKDFARFERDGVKGQIIGGTGGKLDPLFLIDQAYSNKFNDGYLGCTLNTGPFAASISATIHNDNPINNLKGSVVIVNNDTGEMDSSSQATIGPGETFFGQASLEARAGEQLSWFWKADEGHGKCLQSNAIGFGEVGWLTWAR